LPQDSQTPFVDIDDTDEILALGARMQNLIDVKRLLTKGFDRPGVPNAQCEKTDEKQETEDPSTPEAAQPFQKSGHGIGPAGPPVHSTPIHSLIIWRLDNFFC
jgi:hypothetical protein